MERFTFNVLLKPMDPNECVGAAMLKIMKCPITAPNEFEARRAILTRAHLDGKFVRRLELIGKKAMK